MPLHDNSSSLRHDHSCGCQTSNQRMGALSFLQPLCSGQSASERHWPYQWSLMMRAFASWKACMQHPQVYSAASCQVRLALGVCLLLDVCLNACIAVHNLILRRAEHIILTEYLCITDSENVQSIWAASCNCVSYGILMRTNASAGSSAARAGYFCP